MLKGRAHTIDSYQKFLPIFTQRLKAAVKLQQRTCLQVLTSLSNNEKLTDNQYTKHLFPKLKHFVNLQFSF